MDICDFCSLTSDNSVSHIFTLSHFYFWEIALYHPLFSGPLIIALPLFVLGKAVSFRSYRRVAEAKFRDAIWQSSKQSVSLLQNHLTFHCLSFPVIRNQRMYSIGRTEALFESSSRLPWK